ncbi:MAG: hypothetical protein GXO32_02285 [Crenarchaeota archaeon]|nr:hypothetical protein [Thermoproteota archaeon]
MSKKRLPPCDEEKSAALARLVTYLEACPRVLDAKTPASRYWIRYVALGVFKCLSDAGLSIDPGVYERLSRVAAAIEKGMYSAVDDEELRRLIEVVCSMLIEVLKRRRSEEAL